MNAEKYEILWKYSPWLGVYSSMVSSEAVQNKGAFIFNRLGSQICNDHYFKALYRISNLSTLKLRVLVNFSLNETIKGSGVLSYYFRYQGLWYIIPIWDRLFWHLYIKNYKIWGPNLNLVRIHTVSSPHPKCWNGTYKYPSSNVETGPWKSAKCYRCYWGLWYINVRT